MTYKWAYFGEQTGFVPKWNRYNVGTLLFLKVIEDICGDTTAKIYDFGFDDGKHKNWPSSECHFEASAYIFAPRIRPVCVNLVYSTAVSI